MHSLNGEKLLLAWERGLERQEPWRSLALLETAMPEVDTSELATLSLAERNAILLKLRAISFGKRIEGFAVCPDCEVPLEFVMNTDDLSRDGLEVSEDTWWDGETKLRMRPANSIDLAAAMQAPSEQEACTLLLARTLGLHDTAVVPERRPEWVEKFDRLNESSEIRCVLPCAACGARPVLDLDIASFLWREVANAARRLLAEIHRLAAAYGWSDHSIAAMSSTRRNAYLEMLNS